MPQHKQAVALRCFECDHFEMASGSKKIKAMYKRWYVGAKKKGRSLCPTCGKHWEAQALKKQREENTKKAKGNK